MNERFVSWCRAFFFLLLFIIVMVEITMIFAYNAFHDRIFPHTTVAQSSIGLLMPKEAQQNLSQTLRDISATEIEIQYLNESRVFSLKTLGISLFTPEEIREFAPKMNISPLLILKPQEFSDFLYQLTSFRQISIVKNIDAQTLSSTLHHAFPSLFQEKRNASFSLQNNGELTINSEADGLTVDISALQTSLTNHINRQGNDPVSFFVQRDRPIIYTKDLAPYLAVFQETLKNSLSLRFENNNWEISVKELVKAIDFKYNLAYSGSKYAIALSITDEEMSLLDRSAVPLNVIPKIKLDAGMVRETIFEKIGKNFEIAPQDVEISFNADKNILFNATGINGRKILTSSLVKAVESALNNQNFTLALPVEILPAKVSVPKELADKGIKELIATGYSNFSGSPANRMHNIKIGISKFNGLLVAPGEVFSFNEHLGKVDESTGYKKELVIREGNTIPEFGGGLCQVSSTLFRAILFGGLPIIERKAHSYAVSYYAKPLGYGLDSTIYPPDVDLKFKNDTPGYILIQAYTENEDAYFKFYGTSDGRTVEMDGPYIDKRIAPPPDVIVSTDTLAPGERKKVDSAHEGFEALWYRTVKKPATAEGGSIPDTPKETIFSRYKAWPNKYLEGKEETKKSLPDSG